MKPHLSQTKTVLSSRAIYPTSLICLTASSRGPYTVTEKYDGVHVLVFQYEGAWQYSTRTALIPPISLIDTSALLPDKTYCYELIGPSFRNVIVYEKDTAIPLYAIDTASGILEPLPARASSPPTWRRCISSRT